MLNLYGLLCAGIDFLKARAGLVTLKTHTFYARPLHERSVVVDLGGNIGEFAIAATERLGCSCYTVEAIPELFARIPELPQLKKCNFAISDRDGPLDFYSSHNAECGSVFQEIPAQFGVRDIIACEGITFENFLKAHNIAHVDLLKVDIEGAEELLFFSTSDKTLKQIDQITIEFHDFVPGYGKAETVDRIITRLRKLGFIFVPFSYLYPTMERADVLFVRSYLVSIHDFACLVAIQLFLRLEKAKHSLMRRR